MLPELHQATSVRPSSKRSAYLPTLDGWRAIAILAVIFDHEAVHTLGSFSTGFLHHYGYIGVDVFFAISGILICSRLLDEEKRKGAIDIRGFYHRRIFRILPPAFFYLFILILLSGASILSISHQEVVKSVLFCRNYPVVLGGGPMSWYTAHFWSLSIEEQFYFISPALLVLTAKRFRVHVISGICILIAACRAVSLHHRHWQDISFHADVRLDALFVPALFAILAADPRLRPLFQRALRFWPLLVAVTLYLIPHGEGTAWQNTLLIYLMPCIVLGSILNPDNVFGKILEWSWLRYLGRISYSLYLWQQIFFPQHFFPTGLGAWAESLSLPIRLVLTAGCALFSYYLVEQPVVRLGHRLATSTPQRRPKLMPIPIGARTSLSSASV